MDIINILERQKIDLFQIWKNIRKKHYITIELNTSYFLGS